MSRESLSGSEAAGRRSAALAAAALLALLDQLLLPHLVPLAAAPRPGDAPILAGLLLGAGALLALLAAPLRGLGTVVALAALVGAAGRAAADGARARTWPLAEHWWWIGGLLALAVGLAALARPATGPAAVARRGAAALGALLLVYAVARVQVGRYEELRLAATGLALVLLTAARVDRPLARLGLASSSPRIGVALLAAAVAAGALGLGVALVRPATVTWSEYRTPLAGGIAVRLREALLPPLGGEAAGPAVAPYFGREAQREARCALAAAGPPRGVLLVTVDALRADLPGREIGGRATTPFLDELGARGARFDRAYTTAPMSQLAFHSLFSGLAPVHYLADEDFDAVPLVTDRLRDAGVETRAAFAAGTYTIAAGSNARRDYGFERVATHPWDDPPAEALADALRPRGEGRWFAWVHLLRPHYPYDDADPAFRAGEGDFAEYAAEVRQADDDIRRLVGALEAAGVGPFWAIVTADHGEAFREHGTDRHGTQLHEESVRVPMIVVGPGIAPGARPAPVSLADLAPTLDDLFLDDVAPRAYAGRSLLPLLLGTPDPDRPEEVLIDNPPVGIGRWNVAAALVGPRWKLIVRERSREVRLFDLEHDPGEHRDLAATEDERARAMLARLRGRQRRPVDWGPAGLRDEAALLDEAIRRGDEEVLGILLAVADLPTDLLLRGLRQFADFQSPWLVRGLERRLADSRDLDLVAGLDLTRAANRVAVPPASLDAAFARAAESPREELRALAVATALALGRVEDARAVLGDADRRGLPTLVAAAPLLDGDRRRDVLERGLVSPDSRVAREAARLAIDLGVSDLPVRESDLAAEDPVLRFETARRLANASTRDGERWREALWAHADPVLWSGLMSGLALAPEPPEGVARRRFGRGSSFRDCRGLAAFNDYYARVIARRIEIPFAIEDGPVSRLALFLLAPDAVGIDLVVGERRIRLPAASHRPERPIVIELPGGLRADALVLEIEDEPAEPIYLGAVARVTL
ncbi:MAG: sulfatase [Planctomycetota bacterium]